MSDINTNYTVIVAEDEELLLNNLVYKIKNANLGFEVIGTAQTGSQALKLVETLSPDLIITDIRMPVMDGITLLEQMQQTQPYVRSIIISGFADFSYAQKALHLKVAEYLLKPISTDDLYGALLSIRTSLELEKNDIKAVFDTHMQRTSPEQIAHTIKQYIADNIGVDINLNLIAKQLNYSPSYLTKLFLQQFHTTPSKYIISLRITRAKHLLLHHKELSIRQIGELIAYPDQGYFSRCFKKNTGVSPLEFRDNFLEE